MPEAGFCDLLRSLPTRVILWAYTTVATYHLKNTQVFLLPLLVRSDNYSTLLSVRGSKQRLEVVFQPYIVITFWIFNQNGLLSSICYMLFKMMLKYSILMAQKDLLFTILYTQILQLYICLSMWKLDKRSSCKTYCLLICKDISLNLRGQVRKPP